MVELRWLKYQHHQVLQFRQRQPRMPTVADKFGNVMGGGYGPWSEWQDVPEVSWRDLSPYAASTGT